MEKRNKSKWISVFCCCLGISLFLVVALAISGAKAESSYQGYYVDTFHTKLATLAANASLENSDEQGLGVSSKYEGAYAQLKYHLCGDFSLEFSFDELNEGYVVSDFETEFLNENEEKAFSVHVSRTASDCSVCVEIGGVSSGLYYENGSLNGKTDNQNASNVFTHFTLADKYYLYYEQVNGNVCFGTNKDEKTLIWNVRLLSMDGKKSPLAEMDNSYAVRLKLAKMQGAKNGYIDQKAGIIVYSVNGQRLHGEVFTDTAAPTVFAPFVTNAISGEEYKLPAPLALDALEGEIQDVYVEIFANGLTLSKEKYQSGASFFAQEAVAYEITYSATDSTGKTGYFTQELQTVSHAVLEYVFESNFIPKEVGTGSSFVLPVFFARGNILAQETTNNVSVRVSRNGDLLKTYKNLNEFQSKIFTFEESGTYDFSFYVNGIDDGYAVTKTVVADNTIPAIEMQGNILRCYNIGDTVSFPEVVVAQNVTVKRVIYTPNGNAYYLPSGTYRITQAGEYKIEYRVYISGQLFMYDYSFFANEPFVKTVRRANHILSVTDNKYSEIITFYNAQDTVYSDRVIDLRDFGKNESFLEFSYLPQWMHMFDFNDIYIVLTDVYDASNYVTVKLNLMQEGENSYATYCLAGPSSETNLCGIHGGIGSSSTLFINGSWGTRATINPYVKGETVKLAYDIETNIVYINFTSKEDATRGVIDLDSLAYFEKAWKGFTTGEVKLSLRVGELMNVKGQISIEKIGKDYAGGINSATEILLETDGYNEYPNAVVGEEFPLFPAFVMLNGQKLYASVSVCYADYKNIQIATDGKSFTPPYVCDYKVIYTVVTDNEVITKEMTVITKGENPALTVEKDGELSLTAGIECDIPAYTVKNSIGQASVAITFTYENGFSETVKGVEKYTPKYTGKVVVKYVATDYLGRKAAVEYETECISVGKPLFIETVFGLEYMLVGRSYILPTFTAIDYDNCNEILTAKISVVCGDTETVLTTNKYTPLSVEEEIYYVRYTVHGKAGDNSVEYPVRVVAPRTEDGTYNIQQLFLTENATISSSENGLIVTAQNEGATFKFVNGLLADGFNVSFKLLTEDFDKFNIWLTDTEDEFAKIKITFENMGNFVNIRINDTARVYKVDGVSFGASHIFDLSYQAKNFLLYNDGGTLSHNLKLNIFGEDFNGFASGGVNVSFGFEGVNGTASVCILSLNNQSFVGQIGENGLIFDVFEPQILVLGEYGGGVPYNSTYQTFKAKAFDVLGGEREVKISCTYANSSIVLLDATELRDLDANNSYSFTVSQYGTYVVLYTSYDQDGMLASFSYIIHVQDLTPPELTVLGNLYEVYSLGSIVTLPKATATDNLGGEVQLFIVISSPDGLVKYYNGNGEYSFTQRGKYVISYYAYDSANNLTTVDIAVKVL